MIEVDTVQLKNDIMFLNSLIEQYEEIKLNLFNELKDSCINWQDGNSTVFDDNIYLDRQESDMIIQSLKSKKEIFDFVYNKYSDIGKKIRCNLNNKKVVISLIDDCYAEAVSIVNEFNRIDRSFYYPEQYSINSGKDKIISVRNKLGEMKSSVLDLYSKIEKIEQEIKIKINELEKIRINAFNYDLV